MKNTLTILILAVVALTSCQPKQESTLGNENTTDPMQTIDPNYDPEAKIRALGIALDAPSSPVANYVNAVQVGNTLYLSGKGPLKADGENITGKLGSDLSIEQGYQAARITGINQLSVLKAQLGDLKRVKRIVKVLGMVNSDPTFGGQPGVINGCSDLLVEVLGDAGRHTRSAVGFVALPNAISVEIEAAFEVE